MGVRGRASLQPVLLSSLTIHLDGLDVLTHRRELLDGGYLRWDSARMARAKRGVVNFIDEALNRTIATKIEGEVEKSVDEILAGNDFRPLLRQLIELRLRRVIQELEGEIDGAVGRSVGRKR